MSYDRTQVKAYAAHSRSEPLVPTVIGAAGGGRERRAHRHRVRRHLPLRHPHRPRRLGPPALPARPGPRDRRHRRRGRLRGHQAPGRRPGRRRLHGELLPRVRQLPGGRGAVLPSSGSVGTYAATDRDGTITQGGYSTHVVVDEHFALSVPEGLELDVAAPLLCAGITTYSPLRHWGAGPGKKVAVVGLGGLGHMGVKLAHAHGRRGHRAVAVAEEAGGRRCASAPTTTTRPATRPPSSELAGTLRPRSSTRSAPRIDIDAYLRLLAVDGRSGQRRRPGRSRSRSTRSSLDHGPAVLRRLDDRRHPARPRRCSTSAPSTASAPRSRSSRPDEHQRGLRARARLRRPLPVRHRRRDAGLSRQPNRALSRGRQPAACRPRSGAAPPGRPARRSSARSAR